MSTYTKTTNFTAKDNLTSGDPAKVIKGSEFDTEFNAIETAVNSKADKNNGVHTGTTTIATANIDTLQIDGVTVTSTSVELNTLDGFTGDVTDLNKLASVTATATEINVLDGSTASTADLNKLAGVTATSTELNLLDGVTATTAELNFVDGVTSNIQTQLNAKQPLDAQLTDIAGLTPTDGTFIVGNGTNFVAESGDTAIASLGVTATATELNTLDGITATTTELNYTDGVTSNIQTQLNTKADLSGANFTGNVDVTGTVTADGLTVDGDDVLGGSGLFVKTSAGSVGVAYTANDVTIANGETETNAGFINSDNSFVIRLDNNNNGVGDFYVTEGASGKAIIKADNNGDVSFYEDTGTTAKLTWDSSDESLGFGDNVKATFGAGNDLQIYHDGSNSYITDAGTGSLRITAQDFRVRNSANNASMITSIDGGSTYLYDNGSQKLATTATGVDVTGTISADALDIAGTITADGLTVDGSGTTTVGVGSTDGSGARILLDGSANGDFAGGDYSIIENNGSKLNFIGGTPNAPIEFQTHDGSSNKLRQTIASNGDFHLYEDTGTTAKFVWDSSAESLGIGTSTPDAPLDVVAPTTNSVYARLSSTDTRPLQISSFNTASVDAGHDFNATSGNGALSFSTSSSERMRIDSSGNVGIGTASPNSKIHAQKSALSGFQARTQATATFENSTDTEVYIASGSGYTGQLRFGDEGGNFRGAISYNHPSDAFLFYTGGSERARIDSSGNLLVGKTNNDSNAVGFHAQPTGNIWATSSGVLAGNFNRKSSDGEIIRFQKDASTVGSIGVDSGAIEFNGTSAVNFNNGTNEVGFGTGAIAGNGSGNDAVIDLGRSNRRFKDLYLSGGVYLGGTGSANKLDDYEEGDFTPAITNLTGITEGANPSYSGKYTKIGNTVIVEVTANFDSTENVTVNDRFTFSLPFTPNSSNIVGVGNGIVYSSFGSNINGWFNTGVGSTYGYAFCFKVDGTLNYSDNNFKARLIYTTNS